MPSGKTQCRRSATCDKQLAQLNRSSAGLVKRRFAGRASTASTRASRSKVALRATTGGRAKRSELERAGSAPCSQQRTQVCGNWCSSKSLTRPKSRHLQDQAWRQPGPEACRLAGLVRDGSDRIHQEAGPPPLRPHLLKSISLLRASALGEAPSYEASSIRLRQSGSAAPPLTAPSPGFFKMRGRASFWDQDCWRPTGHFHCPP